MTISTINSTYETCSICQIDYTDIERKDTKKVVELACNHFFHMQCIGHWFRRNEKDGRDLSCAYCSQVSVKKYTPRSSLTIESLTAYFEETEKNPIFCYDTKVINCIEKLRALSGPFIDLINNNSISSGRSAEEFRKIIQDWVKDHIDEELQRTAILIILELYCGAGTLQNLEDQIQYLSRIPYEKWPREIETSGVTVYHQTDSNLIRMRVSKNYLERATAPIICDRIHKNKILENHIENIKSFYSYDDGVMNAIPHAINLQKELSRLLKKKPTSSVEKIFLLLENILERMDITDELKEDSRLIIYKFLFNRPALRTLSEEVDRWKKVPVRNWPSFIRVGYVRVLDQYDSLKKYEAADLIKLAIAAGGTLNPPLEKLDIASAAVFGAVITGIFVTLFKKVVINRILN